MDSRSTHVSLEPAAEALADDVLGTLRDTFRGQLLRSDDPGYDEARRVWNGMIDRHPLLIARCTGTADVVAAVRFARTQGLEIAVRGGGHSVTGHAVTAGGLMIDLSPMDAVRVDPDARRAWAQGGALLGQLDHETHLFGLATTAGTVSHTGVGGLTLGGGYGFLARAYGLACDNLVSAEVVTAAGEVLVASEARNPDLLWGLRGGGGNFGIVTNFEFRLHPAVPTVATGDLFFDGDNGPAALRALLDYHDHMPDEMLTSAAVAEVRPEWGIEGLEPGRLVVVISWAFLGDLAEGRRIAAPLYAAAKPVVVEEQALDYLKLQSISDAGQRHGMRRYNKGAFVWDFPDAGIEAFLARGVSPGDPARWAGNLISLGGAIARVGEDDSAYSGRSARFDFLVATSWEDAAEDEERLAGARRYFETMTPYLPGPAYINSLEDEGIDRIRAAYGPAKYDRLAALKRQYDPDNVFHLNQNIRPA